MNTKTFFQDFELFADAPNGVEKLRELILQLAVQGKLVPQNPDDEPASVLLEKIKKEKERLIKEGKIKRSKSLSPVDVDEIAFGLPHGWEWVRLGEVTRKLGAGSTPKGGKKVYQKTGIKFLRSQNVWNDGLRIENVAYIPLQIHQRMSGTHVEPGDILLNITGASIGRSSVVPDNFDEGNVSQHVAIVRLIDKSIRCFIHISLISSYVQNLIMGVQVGISREGLSMSSLKDFLIPLPPFHEAKRIVAKVDALMKLCDELETRQQKKRDRILKLGQVATTKLITPSTPESFKQHWKTISDNFDLLYSTPENVSQLRQAILQLAVMGKLVPQNPDDEPASVLLEKIKEEKERLIKEGKNKKSKKLPPVDVGEMAFEVPQGWEWVRLGELTIFGPRNGYSPKPVEYLTSVKTLTLSATTSGKFDSQHFKYIDKQIEPDSHLWLENQDLLIQRANSLEYVGVAAIYKGNAKEFIYPDLMMKIRFPKYLDINYLYQTINSKSSRRFLRERASGTSGSMPKINQLTVNSLPIPLPSLTEQHRIVTKVNQLMKLCDELEAKLTQSISDRDKLMSAAVRQVLAA
ncbi:restriction endonuclease subunit S [Mastigocoleus testarum]|uniref:Type I restriction modification DNA specificity domain-containing protein n=1 Tax=Mastigocoleus testarum BC008 TaxID=371196 RepID=A0A0V7ZF46_9CYAN|nr:restriction endonuclease subunit S [Mastigocoleus testarum]KST63071.1 hypothetical protein BC008_12225 [Mastigocoleus testarum BC008]KST69070.1 hypothetical protein BC008_34670 [Mastigocoleus testarum BC008]